MTSFFSGRPTFDPSFLHAYDAYDKFVSSLISSDKSELSDQQRVTESEFSDSARGYEIFRDFIKWEQLSRSVPLLSPGDAICDEDGFPHASFTNG